MCGRYLSVMESEIAEYREIINEVNERYKNTPELSEMASGEVFPSNIAPVLVSETGISVRLMRWGFPKWQGGGVIINARSETALEKKLFRPPLLNKRCAVPCAGFFEWRQEPDKKQKYLFRAPNAEALYMAGVFDTFGGESAFVILTVPADESVSPYHSRMPLMLAPRQISQWLADLDFALGCLQTPHKARLFAAAV